MFLLAFFVWLLNSALVLISFLESAPLLSALREPIEAAKNHESQKGLCICLPNESFALKQIAEKLDPFWEHKAQVSQVSCHRLKHVADGYANQEDKNIRNPVESDTEHWSWTV